MKIYGKDNREWPVAENELTRIEALLPELKEKENTLAQEQKMAIKKENRNQLRNKLGRVEKSRQELEDAEKAAQHTPILTDIDLEELRTKSAKLDQLRASVTASKLSVRLLAKSDLSVIVQEGISEPRSQEIASGDHFRTGR